MLIFNILDLFHNFRVQIYMMPYIYGNFELFFVSWFLFFKYH